MSANIREKRIEQERSACRIIRADAISNFTTMENARFVERLIAGEMQILFAQDGVEKLRIATAFLSQFGDVQTKSSLVDYMATLAAWYGVDSFRREFTFLSHNIKNPELVRLMLKARISASPIFGNMTRIAPKYVSYSAVSEVHEIHEVLAIVANRGALRADPDSHKSGKSGRLMAGPDGDKEHKSGKSGMLAAEAKSVNDVVMLLQVAGLAENDIHVIEFNERHDLKRELRRIKAHERELFGHGKPSRSVDTHS